MTIKIKPLTLFAPAILALIATACTQTESVANDSGVHFVKKEGGNPEVLAKFDGKDIKMEDLEKANPDIFDARIRLFYEQKRGVEEYVRNAVLDSLAKKANLSTEEFMTKEMDSAKKRISEKNVDAFLNKNGMDPGKVPPQVRDQVKGLLHVQGLVSKATKSNKVEIYLARPKTEAAVIKVEGEPTWGSASAPVTIVEFSDFQCPYCAQGKERLAELKKIYGKKIRVVYKNFPLPSHPNARPAAEAAMCVNEQSSDKFWKYHDKLFENQDKLSEEDLKSYAKNVGVDMKKFEECFSAKKHAGHIDAGIEEARKIGVSSTPSFFINGQPIRGARQVTEFQEVIDEALGSK